MSYIDRRNVSVMLGQTLVEIINYGDGLLFKTTTGKSYKMYHQQDCCESVGIEDIVGDLDDLIGTPLLVSEEVEGYTADPTYPNEESYTWTYYKFATIKGYVDIRWYGSSNGYYSEGVDFEEVPNGISLELM